MVQKAGDWLAFAPKPLIKNPHRPNLQIKVIISQPLGTWSHFDYTHTHTLIHSHAHTHTSTHLPSCCFPHSNQTPQSPSDQPNAHPPGRQETERTRCSGPGRRASVCLQVVHCDSSGAARAAKVLGKAIERD